MILHLRNATQVEAETIPPGPHRRHPSIPVWIQWNGQWKTQQLTIGAVPPTLTGYTALPLGAPTVEISLLATRSNRSRSPRGGAR